MTKNNVLGRFSKKGSLVQSAQPCKLRDYHVPSAYRLLHTVVVSIVPGIPRDLEAGSIGKLVSMRVV